MLIIGIGNEMRGDDAAGLIAARRIQDLNLPGITVVEHSGEGASLMETWKNQEEVIVIDAARSKCIAGTIHRYDAHRDSLPADVFAFSTHVLGLAQAIELSRSLGTLPKTLIVYGIEGNDFELNHTISQEVQSAIDSALPACITRRLGRRILRSFAKCSALVGSY
jgi:hydrogenase maturation protease